LLKKIRKQGRNSINIYSVTKTNGLNTGMCIGHNGGNYSGLFKIGDTEEQIKNKAMKIWLKENIENIRKQYRKYKRKNKNKYT